MTARFGDGPSPLWRTTAVCIGAVLALGCSAEPPAPDVALLELSADCVAPDSGQSLAPPWEIASPDQLPARIDSLEARVRVAGTTDLPALLFDLGRTKLSFAPHRRTPHESLASTRPQEYRYNEVGANWLYNGADLRELIRRFPNHELADDAAYSLIFLPRGGECEGSASCYIEWRWAGPAEFLRTFPTSALADSALQLALFAFRVLPRDADLRVPTAEVQPDLVRQRVAALDSLAAQLTGQHSARLLRRAGQLWEQFSEYERARVAFQTALPRADDELRRCLAAQLAALPARWLTLEPTTVVHPRRVDLRWQPNASIREVVVYRSESRHQVGDVVARLPADARSWTDTATRADSSYWYRVIVHDADGAVPSNPAHAETPSDVISIQAAAVSTSDGALYVFGTLSNDFPRVIRISPDGHAIERSDGTFTGQSGWEPWHQYDQYTDHFWIADQHGRGVLHFRDTNGRLPQELVTTVRRGLHLLATPWQFDVRVLASVDERRRAAWLERGGGGYYHATRSDCMPDRDECWIGVQSRLALRAGAGDTIAHVRIARESPNDQIGSLRGDPADGGVWLHVRGTGTLLKFDRQGALQRELEIAPRLVLREVAIATADNERSIWFTRADQHRGLTLERIALDDATATPQQVAERLPNVNMILPEGDGGVWLIATGRVARVLHIDRAGNILVDLAVNEAADRTPDPR